MLLDISLAKTKDGYYTGTPLCPANFPWLAGVSKSFERYKWRRLNIHFRSAGGFTKGGLLAMGVDWYTTAAPALTQTTSTDGDRKTVLALSPHASWPIAAVGSSRKLGLPHNLLNSRAWYKMVNDVAKQDGDSAVGQILLSVKADAEASNDRFIGEVWVDYEIVLQGTKQA